jgi:hypothetical protein
MSAGTAEILHKKIIEPFGKFNVHRFRVDFLRIIGLYTKVRQEDDTRIIGPQLRWSSDLFELSMTLKL